MGLRRHYPIVYLVNLLPQHQLLWKLVSWMAVVRHQPLRRQHGPLLPKAKDNLLTVSPSIRRWLIARVRPFALNSEMLRSLMRCGSVIVLKQRYLRINLYQCLVEGLHHFHPHAGEESRRCAICLRLMTRSKSRAR